VRSRRSDNAAPPRVAREGGAAEASRRGPRELYDAVASAGPGDPPDDASRDTPFRGEYEQHGRGPEAAGQSGRLGSDASLRQQLCQRLAQDPRLAGAPVDVAVDGRALTLSGEIVEPAVRDWILEHARGLGIEDIHDSLRVVP
jgi:BON domain